MNRIADRLKNKKNKAFFTLISLLAAVILVAVGTFVYGSGISLRVQNIELTDITDVAKDCDGNIYVLNNGGHEVLRINEDGDTDLVIKALGSGERTFERGLDIAVDDEGNIYVHNRIASEDAVSWIGKENIVVYGRNGAFLYNTCNTEYDVPALNPSIVSLQEENGDVYAISADENGVTADNLTEGGCSIFQFDDADRLISSAVFSGEESCIYATTLDGRIIRVTRDSGGTLFATPEGDTSMGSFTDIEIDDEGSIYVSDAITETVEILEGDELETAFEPGSIVYAMDYHNGFAFNETYAIEKADGSNDCLISTTDITGWALIRTVAVICIAVLLILSLIFPLFVAAAAIVKSGSHKARLLTGVTLIVAAITAVFCTLVARDYTDIFTSDLLDLSLNKARIVCNLIDTDALTSLDSVTDFGSDEYNKVKTVIDNVILDDGTVPGDMFLTIYTLDDDGTVTERYTLEENVGCNYPYIWTDGVDEARLYKTGETISSDNVTDSEGSFISVLTPIKDDNGNVVGLIEAGADRTIFKKNVVHKILYFAMSIVAVAVVFVLLFLELIEFRDAQKDINRKHIASGEAVPPLKIYRAAVFIITFVTNLTTPFLSIYSLTLADSYGTVFGISPEILAAVPISAEVLFGAIFSMAGGNIIDRLGCRKSAILGSVLFTAGLSVRFFMPDLMVLTLGNAIQGAGWGIVLLIINSRIASEEDEKISEQGFTDYNIAMQNGINSGIVLGGFLLAFANYTWMLVIAAVMSLTIFIFSYCYIFDEKKEMSRTKTEREGSGRGIRGYIRFVFSPRVLVYFVFIVIPVIAASYYLNFLYPILGDRLGLSESLIGYSYLINGMVIICFGNLIVNFTSKYFDRKLLLMIASLMYLVTFALIGILDNVPALLISLVLLAVSDSFGYVAQSTFYTDLKETEEFGYERAMGVYSLFENLAQAAGSFVFGYILTVGVRVGMTVYGLVIGAFGVIFAMAVSSADKVKKIKEKEKE